MSLHIFSYHSPVSKVTEIDDEILNIVHRSATISKQCLDITQQALHLFLDLSEVEHVAITVDTRRAGDIIHPFVGEREACAPLESDAILLRGVEPGGSMEILQLFGLDTWECEEVDGDLGVTCLRIAPDTGARHKMGLCRETIAPEDIVAGTHYACIIVIDVCHVDPSPDEMVTDVQVLLFQTIDIALKERQRLQITAVARDIIGREAKTLKEEVVVLTCLDKQRYLRAVGGRLPHDSAVMVDKEIVIERRLHEVVILVDTVTKKYFTVSQIVTTEALTIEPRLKLKA